MLANTINQIKQEILPNAIYKGIRHNRKGFERNIHRIATGTERSRTSWPNNNNNQSERHKFIMLSIFGESQITSKGTSLCSHANFKSFRREVNSVFLAIYKFLQPIVL